MRLSTDKGDLELNEGFSFEIVRNNPFLSSEGDYSVPASIPATRHNLALLGHTERIDRATRHMNRMPATLSHGSVVKNGQLVIDTVMCNGGIDVSFAIENSDLYSQHKDKPLKSIFKDMKESFGSVKEVMSKLCDIYYGRWEKKEDYTVFPVWCGTYEDNDGNTVYQMNNQPDEGGSYIVSQRRQVREGDATVEVPEGYGVSPFIYLGRMLALAFETIGYSVEFNCFDTEPYDKIVVLNNCSDTVVKGEINYADLVPSCTLGELLDFIVNKFHAQAIVDSTSRKVRIELFDVAICGAPADDITASVDGEFSLQVNPDSRVVLRSDTSIEGAEPAAETFEELIERYGGYVEADEMQFASLDTQTPYCYDCLLLRQATGEFFALLRDMSDGSQVKNRLGTNYMPYDRHNSQDTEVFSAADMLPPMVADGDMCAPYIGGRKNMHTSYLGSEPDKEQGVIVVVEWKGKGRRGGTTQDYAPLAYSRELEFGTAPFKLYETFWKEYNYILLNYKMELSGKRLAIAHKLLIADMSRPVSYKGQTLVPLSSSAVLGEKTSEAECSYMLFKRFDDGYDDEPVHPGILSRLRWRFINSAEQHVSEHIGQLLDGWEHETENLLQRTDLLFKYEGYSIDYTDKAKDVYLGHPVEEYEISSAMVREASIIYNCFYALPEAADEWKPLPVATLESGVRLTLYFVAERY